MTLQNLIDLYIIGGSQFELIDSDSLETIGSVYGASFTSFRFRDKQLLNREVSRIYSYCPAKTHNCFGQTYSNEGKDTVTVIELEPQED